MKTTGKRSLGARPRAPTVPRPLPPSPIPLDRWVSPPPHPPLHPPPPPPALPNPSPCSEKPARLFRGVSGGASVEDRAKVATVSQFATQKRQHLSLIPAHPPCAGPPRSPRKWHKHRSSQTSVMARHRSDPHRAAIRWAPQDPAKLATVSQLATPNDGKV